MREARKDLIGTSFVQSLGDLADRPAGIAHVIDYQTILAGNVTDDIHHVCFVSTLATFVAECQSRVEPFRVSPGPLSTAGIRSNDDEILDRVFLKYSTT